ncbi:tetratricopeptide repeat protein 28-like [Watersipora subatra]|uniref:tetratricopeptide repeat protein 28-like n=1 Tax=Watersipora subatra TaxID=2589382 RepID=UPI00355C0C34
MQRNLVIKYSQLILQTSIDVLKKKDEEAPCKFAIIGLGSIAKGDATPYSDLEYAIIVEKESEYFERLAIDSYFRIGNLGESPLKSFDIDELKTNSELSKLAMSTVTGYRIDGITTNSGNIPTGNGKEGGLCLILTVEQLMKLYKTEAEKPIDELADKSDMLSSTIVLLSNDEDQGTSQLYTQFTTARASYEKCGEKKQTVEKKRFKMFASDMEKYVFLPEFVKFQPPDNLNVKVKEKIFRYPTLLANNMKMCLGLSCCNSWDIYSELQQQGLLSPDIHQYLNIILALSIYIRTSAYLMMQSQSDFVQIDQYYKGSQELSYAVPAHLVVLMGCLLIPIKQSVKYKMALLTASTDGKEHCRASSLLGNIEVPKNDFWVKAEVFYFTGQYFSAKTEISKAFGKPVDSISCSSCCEILNSSTSSQLDSPKETFKKRIELCAYLLYYTQNYKYALEYFQHFLSEQKQQGLWKLLAAHCHKEIGEYRAAKQLIKEVDGHLTLSSADNHAVETETHHRDASDTYTNFGSVYMALSEYEKAKVYFTKALKATTSVYGDIDHPNIAANLSDIGSAHCSLGNYTQALEYANKALAVNEAFYGKGVSNTDVAKSYAQIGRTYSGLGDHRLALEYFMKAIDMLKAVNEVPTHASIAGVYNDVGRTYCHLGNYELALEYYQKSLDLKQRMWGRNTSHVSIAISHNCIGMLHQMQRKFKTALESCTKALNMRKDLFGEDTNHTDVATSYNNLGSLYRSLRDYKQSLEYHKKALAMRKAVYGEDACHIDIAASYNNIGCVCYDLTNYTQALEYHFKALVILKKVYREGSNHANIAETYNNLGAAYSFLGDYKLAIAYFMKAITMWRAVYGENSYHRDFPITHSSIGAACYALGDYRSAIEYHKKALHAYKQANSEISCARISIEYKNIALAYHSLGDYKSALEYYTMTFEHTMNTMKKLIHDIGRK